LFTTAIDTMLHGQDLLKITVKDVQSTLGQHGGDRKSEQVTGGSRCERWRRSHLAEATRVAAQPPKEA
jgi:hypothetical protein